MTLKKFARNFNGFLKAFKMFILLVFQPTNVRALPCETIEENVGENLLITCEIRIMLCVRIVISVLQYKGQRKM